jgi:hypothetical protein
MEEFIYATEWWCSQINNNYSLEHKLNFKLSLIESIYDRCKDHWYPDNSIWGYRSIINDVHTDPLLIKACTDANINSSCLPTDCVQIINPGNVYVRCISNDNIKQIIFIK